MKRPQPDAESLFASGATGWNEKKFLTLVLRRQLCCQPLPTCVPAKNRLAARRKRIIRIDPYAAQNWRNRSGPQDYRKFLKFVGPSYRNYLSDRSLLLAPHTGATRQAKRPAGGSLPTMSHLRLCARRGRYSGRDSGGKRLPACPHPDLDRVWRAPGRYRLVGLIGLIGAGCSKSGQSNGFDRSPPAVLADANFNQGADQKDLTQPTPVTKDRPDPDICARFARQSARGIERHAARHK